MDNSVISQLKEIEKRLDYPEQRLGKELAEPFPAAVSGARKLLYASQTEQAMSLVQPEVPFIQTGYENEFGHRSTSFKQLGFNCKVIGKIEKFSFNPGWHYFLIVYNEEENKLSVLERTSYQHRIEEYGYNNDVVYLDNKQLGDTLNKGDVWIKSTSFDEFNNRMDGVNLLCTYLATNLTTEDAIIISESGAKKMASNLISKEVIMVNENDIMLNVYGNDTIYKVIPDLLEPVQNNIIAALRRENKQESLFAQSYNNLRNVTMSDEKIIGGGRIVDINIYSNNPQLMVDSIYNSQLNVYYQNSLRYMQEIVQCVDEFKYTHPDVILDPLLDEMYTKSAQILSGYSINYKDSIFSNIIIELTMEEYNSLHEGDKLTNRYGGKGVISKIVPDELMPRRADGSYVELIFNQGSTTNRLNPAQLFEVELNGASSALLNYLSNGVSLPIDDSKKEDFVSSRLDTICEFLSIISPKESEEFRKFVESYPKDEQFLMMYNIVFNDPALIMSIMPIQENVTIDILNEIYKRFPMCKMQKALTKIKDSTGNFREIKTLNPLLIGHQYFYRLKQYGKEKFSVTSLSFTDNKNENSRNKSSGQNKGVFTNTPIRFGNMESGLFSHIGNTVNVMMLMLYSSSPHARRLTKKLLTDSPFKVNLKLDKESKSRKAEIFNVMLKAIGMKMVFIKRKKKKVAAFIRTNPVFKYLTEKEIKFLEENKDKIKIEHDKNGNPYFVGLPSGKKPAFVYSDKDDEK